MKDATEISAEPPAEPPPTDMRLTVKDTDGTVHDWDAYFGTGKKEPETEPDEGVTHLKEQPHLAESRTNERGKPFEPVNTYGQGRPPGSHNNKLLRLREMLLDRGEEIMFALIEGAKQGKRVPRRLAMARLLPRLKPAVQLAVEEAVKITQELRIVFVDGHNLDPDLPRLPDDELEGTSVEPKEAHRSIEEGSASDDIEKTHLPIPLSPTPSGSAVSSLDASKRDPRSPTPPGAPEDRAI